MAAQPLGIICLLQSALLGTKKLEVGLNLEGTRHHYLEKFKHSSWSFECLSTLRTMSENYLATCRSMHHQYEITG